jgi:hypothetical protein
MTSLSARRARVLRMRSIEHKVAVARLAKATSDANSLEAVARRIATLRNGLGTLEGQTSGQVLSAMAEMAGRLDRAGRDLVQPIAALETTRIQIDAERMKARIKKEGASKLHSKAAASDDARRTTREDANRPFVRRRAGLGGYA